ncbi:MAG: metal-sensitive transcriptional regulator [Pseudomonadota bacterium]
MAQQHHCRRDSILKRLRRIEGQVRGLARMVEEDRYCIDILTQMQAVKAALRRAEEEVLKDHADHCIADAIHSGEPAEQRKKFSELIDLMGKFGA